MRPPRHLFALGLILLLGALYVVGFGGNTAGPADNAGYMTCASMLSHGQLREALRPIRGVHLDEFSTMVFCTVGHRPGVQPWTIVPVYPVGFPLHMALASFVVGLDRAAIVVNLLAWLAVVPALYLLGRRLELPPAWCLAGLVVFACFPVTMLHYTRVMSDALATTWSVVAFLLAFASRDRRWLAVASGVAFSIAVLVRPTDALLAPGLVLALGWNLRTLASFVAGAAPGGAALMAYNYALYGKLVAAGYTGMGENFSASNLGGCLAFYSLAAIRYLSPVFLALLAYSVWLACRGDRRHLVLLAWGGAIAGLYCFYYHSLTGTWWELRFILPALPALLLAALLAARELQLRALARWGETPRGRRLVSAALVLALVWPVASGVYQVASEKVWNGGRVPEFFEKAAEWMDWQIEPDAVVMAANLGGAVYHYTNHPVLRWDLITPADFHRFRAAAAANGVPIYALLMGVELEPHAQRYPGMFSAVGHRPGASLWRLKPQ